ncbi:MAG: hypothetical protein DSZ07_06885 [Sulfurovum sp.]|nr:MAG: hypothetical protein DSZ07_06885 [Sulfurovum sp.]
MQTINLYNNLFEIIKTRLNKAYNPISLYIFGSYAWGTPTKDILVYTKDEFKMLSQDVSSLLYKVEKEGIKLI